MVGWFEGTENDLSTGLTRTIIETEMNSIRSKPSQYATVYEGCLEFSFGIFKSNGDPISYAESRTINKWLTDPKHYRKLVFPGEQNIYYMAICTDIVDVIYNGHNGKNIVFRTDSPFGYTSPITKTINVLGSKKLKLFNDGDDGSYYPILSISSISDDIVIKNVTDNQSMILSFKDLDSRVIIVDNERMRITDSDNKLIPVYKIGWDNLDNIYWFRLLQGKNEIEIEGDCTFTITASFPRKVGMV